MLSNTYPPLHANIMTDPWQFLIHCANYFPLTSTFTFITIPPYQQPNNDCCCFFTVLCPTSWLSSFYGGCFKVHSNPLEWNSAKSKCEEPGSNLAVLNSKAELREFPQLLKSAGASQPYLWIGLYRDPKNERQWLWVDGSTVHFTFWDTRQPDNFGSNEDCVEFRLKSKKWNDRHCSHSLPYICEISGKYNTLHEHIYMTLHDLKTRKKVI